MPVGRWMVWDRDGRVIRSTCAWQSQPGRSRGLGRDRPGCHPHTQPAVGAGRGAAVERVAVRSPQSTVMGEEPRPPPHTPGRPGPGPRCCAPSFLEGSCVFIRGRCLTITVPRTCKSRVNTGACVLVWKSSVRVPVLPFSRSGGGSLRGGRLSQPDLRAGQRRGAVRLHRASPLREQ